MIYASSNKVFVNFGCKNKCRETVYRVPVSELIISGIPICPDCDKICEEVSQVEVEKWKDI